MFVQIIPQVSKMALLQGSNVLHRLIKGKHETTGPRALIFGMQHGLVDHYQFVQVIPLGPKMSPRGGSNVLHRLIKGKREKRSYLKPKGLEP